jgi:chromosomal replication initiator protein
MESMVKETIFVWENCLSLIEKGVSPQAFVTWFKPLKPLDFKNNTLYIGVPHQFFFEWIESHFKQIVNETIKSIVGNEAIISFQVMEQSEEIIHQTEPVTLHYIDKPENKIIQNDFDSNLNHKYTFDNYVMGDNNQMARSVALAVAKQPGQTSFNPLFIYGDVGLGKTHLIQAVGNEAKTLFPEKRILYVSSEKFTNDFTDAISKNRTNEFSNFYRSLDILIVDDIQFFSGKEKTQETFFHTFNTLQQQNKQIILSSDKPPKDLKGIPERLVSRFQWGLIADIQLPDFETRTAILKRKSEYMGMSLDAEILEFLALNITSNIRELEGSLVGLLAESSISFKPITIDLAKEVIQRTAFSQKKKSLSVEQIQTAVSEFYGIPVTLLNDKTRKQEIAFARQVAMFLSKEMTKYSLKTIGLIFGGRDHSTVIHAHNTIQELMKENSSITNDVNTIRKKLELQI